MNDCSGVVLCGQFLERKCYKVGSSLCSFDLRLLSPEGVPINEKYALFTEESKIHTILYHFRFTEGRKTLGSVGMRPEWSTRKESGDRKMLCIHNGRHRKGSLNILVILSKNLSKGNKSDIFSPFITSLNWSFWPQLFLPLTKLCFVCLLGSFFFFRKFNFATLLSLIFPF